MPQAGLGRADDPSQGAPSRLVRMGRASFEQLAQYPRLLLLQGPNGPFFSRLRKKLEAAGSEVWKVNFNGGDDLFYRGGRIVRFTQPMPMWESFLRDLVARLHIDAIVVFGSSRRQHRIAARVAKALGVAFWVFEEGYVRPDYITLEAGGVNADSPFASLALDDVPAVPAERRRVFKRAFWKMVWFAFWYFAAGMAARRWYADYRHHKPFGVHEVALWLRAAVRKHRYRWQQRKIAARLLSDTHPPFFLLALQVYNDSQIRVHSPWRRMEDFIEWAVHSFAANAPRDAMLVIKHHPMDRGHTNYANCIKECAARFGVAGRLAYVHDLHLPSLLHRCDGLVTINSTTALQALYHRVPVIALGRCFYAKEGLTYQGSLDDFWRCPTPVDMATYRRFRNFLVYASQINSSFYADATLSGGAVQVSWLTLWRTRFGCALGLLFADTFATGELHLSSLRSVVHWASTMLIG
jgi:capsular polysaccharide export protein